MASAQMARRYRVPSIVGTFATGAKTPDWQAGPVEAVFLSNLLHLLPETEAANVVKGAARVLTPGGRFCLYGPFKDGGAYRSEGDARFDAQLRASDPEIGYKSVEWVTATARTAAGTGTLLRIRALAAADAKTKADAD